MDNIQKFIITESNPGLVSSVEMGYKEWLQSELHQRIVNSVLVNKSAGSCFYRDLLKVTLSGKGIEDHVEIQGTPVRAPGFGSYINTFHYGTNIIGLKTLRYHSDTVSIESGPTDYWNTCNILAYFTKDAKEMAQKKSEDIISSVFMILKACGERLILDEGKRTDLFKFLKFPISKGNLLQTEKETSRF